MLFSLKIVSFLNKTSFLRYHTAARWHIVISVLLIKMKTLYTNDEHGACFGIPWLEVRYSGNWAQEYCKISSGLNGFCFAISIAFMMCRQE